MAVENNPSSRPWYADSGSVDAATTGGNTEKPLMEQAKQQTQHVLQQTQQKAGQVVEQARTQVMDQLSSQKERAAGSLESVAQALRQTGQHLREQDQAPVAGFAEGAADTLERFTGYLNERNVDEMVREVENFARRQPGLFLAGAFALGFMAARFLKSSSQTDGAMADYRSSMPYSTGQYRAETADLAHPVDVAGVAAADAGRMGTASYAAPTVGSSIGTPGAPVGTGTSGSPMGTTPAASPTSVPVDVDEEGDLVTTTGTEHRSEAQP
jgi:ElaB/YqjD/DUF883 family membrane-anchored ribosome-binding protein